ncbi:sensor histidine kinase [Thermodesulfobacteriota bacterium]
MPAIAKNVHSETAGLIADRREEILKRWRMPTWEFGSGKGSPAAADKAQTGILDGIVLFLADDSPEALRRRLSSWCRQLVKRGGSPQYAIGSMIELRMILGEIIKGEGKRVSGSRTEALMITDGIIDGCIRRIARQMEMGLKRELRRREKELGSVRAMLLSTERIAASGRLTAILAHEVNNPLAIIKTSLQLINRKVTDKELIDRDLRNIDAESNRIAHLTKQLFDFYKPERSFVQPTNLDMVLVDVLNLVEKRIESRGIRLIKDLAVNLPKVLVAPDEMKQVFLMLITFSERSMPRGGTLTISSRHEGSYVHCILSDTGEGLSEARLKNLFDPLGETKGEALLVEEGLGLPVSFRIIRNHHGTLDAESRRGEGTAFRIRIPVYSK